MAQALALVFLTLLGLCVGSFCNVLIYRLPKGEDFVKTRSHCMACGHVLAWYELLPLLSFLLQGGKCRACGAKLSPQYPIVEGLNGGMWLLTGLLFWGDWLHAALYCALFSCCWCWRSSTGAPLRSPTAEPGRRPCWARSSWRLILKTGPCMLPGAARWVSLLFLLLWFLTGGKGLGMGDVKLMAAAGLLLAGPASCWP